MTTCFVRCVFAGANQAPGGPDLKGHGSNDFLAPHLTNTEGGALFLNRLSTAPKKRPRLLGIAVGRFVGSRE